VGGINIVCLVANTMHPLCSSVRGSAGGPSQCLSAELTARAWRVGLGWDFKVQRREADQRPWEGGSVGWDLHQEGVVAVSFSADGQLLEPECSTCMGLTLTQP